jgi:GxxExxY protein
MITPNLSKIVSTREKRDPQTYAIIGAGLAVHRELGHGFLEAVFQEALEVEFQIQGIQHLREHPFQITYKGRPLKSSYRCDFLCFGDVIVEIKALKELTSVEESQVLNYLKAAKLTRAILLNFGARSLEYKRIVLDYEQSPEAFPKNLRTSA